MGTQGNSFFNGAGSQGIKGTKADSPCSTVPCSLALFPLAWLKGLQSGSRAQGSRIGQWWPSLVIGAAVGIGRFVPLRFPFVPPVARRFCTGRSISGGEDEGRGRPWRLPLISRFSRPHAVSPASRRGTSSSSTGNWMLEVGCWILITGFQPMRCLPLFRLNSHDHHLLPDVFGCR
jgi:hypothetical protein